MQNKYLFTSEICNHEYQDFDLLFRFFLLKFSEKSEFSIEDITEFLYYTYIVNRNLKVIEKLLFAFTHFLCKQKQNVLTHEYILGSLIGSFCIKSDFKLALAIDLNKRILQRNILLYYELPLKHFISKRKVKLIKNSILFYVSQFFYYETIEEKATIFRELFTPIGNISEFYSILDEYEKSKLDKDLKSPKNELFDNFFHLYFVPLFNNLNLNSQEKGKFFTIWDKKGYFLFILYKKNFLEFLNVKIMQNEDNLRILDSNIFSGRFNMEMDWDFNSFFGFRD